MQTRGEAGLCSKCKGAAGCDVRLEATRPVNACKAFEAFEYFVPAILQGHVQKETASVSVRASGLCADCGSRDTCMFRRPEGGVWHCEEYC